MNYVHELISWDIARELLDNLCILFTLITLLSQYNRDKLLEIQNESKRGLRFGVILFSILAFITMQLPIQVPQTEGVFFDLRLSFVVLATSYLGLQGGLIVAAFTVIVRSVSGGIGAVWWGGSVFFLVLLAYFIIRAIPSRQTALITAGVATATAHMGILFILALFSAEVNNISPYASPENFIRLTSSFIIAMALGVWVLDKTLRNIMKFENHYSELKSKANIDGMTGLFNYRHFKELFEQMIKESDAHPLSLLMIDIDHFKKYNDTYGHTEGDIVLRKIAEVISSCVRHCDIVARYGGEEFVVVLPRTANRGACDIAERIRRSIEDTRFPHSKVTVSIGVAACDDLYCSGRNDMVVNADKSLYAAKQAGRNRVGGCGVITALV